MSYFKFNTDGLELIRSNYYKAVQDKELCEKMIAELTKTKNKSATHLAYLGSFQTISANHVFSPFNKLNNFKEGKENLEKAVQKEPNSVEVRFLRLSVQKKAPSFLGYKANINEDTEFIKKNYHQIDSEVLQNYIQKLLKD